MADLLIGRQPIFNRQQQVVGYELLYRSPQSLQEANFVDGDFATGNVIINAFSVIGLDTLVGKHIAFFNLTGNFILGKFPIPFPPQRVALEVLENVIIDKALVTAVSNFAKLGYRIVLDDVDNLKKVELLLPYTKIVKVDLLAIQKSSLPQMVTEIKNLNIKALAEKVETIEELEYCQKLGFDFFQGYYLCKPNIVQGKRMDTSRLVVVNAIARIQDPEANFKKLEELIAQDSTLTYKLIRLVNSAYYSTANEVKSIGQAISLIGTDNLRGWLMLVLMASIDNKPHELTMIGLLRARFCEMLARAKGVKVTDQYFMIGLLSIMDALLDMPIDQVVIGLNLSDDIVEALLNRKGLPGSILSLVIAYEQGDMEKMMMLGLRPEAISDSYIKSLKWASTLGDSLRN